MSEPYLTQIYGWGINFAVRGWAFCEGQILAISTHQSLYSLLGTSFGGDGRTTFELPDLRGRIAFSSGQGPGLPSHALGKKGGNYQITQTAATMAAHDHGAGSIGAAATLGTVIAPDATSVLAVPVAPGGNVTAYAPVATQDTLISGEGGTTGNVGGSQPMTIQNPYIAISYEIAILGHFPSRN